MASTPAFKQGSPKSHLNIESPKSKLNLQNVYMYKPTITPEAKSPMGNLGQEDLAKIEVNKKILEHVKKVKPQVFNIYLGDLDD
jgi:hypothetical protein